MAEQLGIPLNALRIRMYRLRQDLETCILDCTKRLGKS
jgi:DNA-directed RNA polymerase specialized sigma24 family protein